MTPPNTNARPLWAGALWQLCVVTLTVCLNTLFGQIYAQTPPPVCAVNYEAHVAVGDEGNNCQSCEHAIPQLSIDLSNAVPDQFTPYRDIIRCADNTNPYFPHCYADPTNNCALVKLTISTDLYAGVEVDIAGAPACGSFTYRVDCSPISYQSPRCGDNVGCLQGEGDIHYLTICKPGTNDYAITIRPIAKPEVFDDTVRVNCSIPLSTVGFSTAVPPTWTLIGSTGGATGTLATITGNSNTFAAGNTTGTVTYEICGLPLASNCGVSSCATTTITIIPQITATLPPTVGICPTQSASLSPIVSNAVGTVNYLWSTGATTATISAGIGAYSVTITDQYSCTDIVATTEVVLNPPPSISFSGDTNICNNGTATISASGGATYLWSGPSVTSTNQNDNPLTIDQGGTYYVTVTSAEGCSNTGSVVITQAPPLVANATATAVACYGDATAAIDLTVSGGTTPYTYSWTGGLAAVQDPSNVAAGTYSVTVTDARACTGTATVTISQPAAALSASATLGSNVSCYGGTDGSATASASGGTAPYTYAWSNGTTGDALNDVAAGTYTVTATDDNGCTATASVTISQPTAALNASATLGSNVSCYGENDGSATASASGGTAPYTYAWSNGTTGDALNDVAAGTYTVTATDDNGCTATASVTISQPTAALNASAALGNNVSCYGGSDGSATASASGGTAPYTYVWSNGTTGDALNDVAAGNYTVTATDDNGCTATASVTISQPTAALNASATLGSNVSCYGGADGSATASASGGTAPYTYAWSNGTTGDALNDVAAGTYTVTATDDNGCTATASVTISQPTAALNASATLGSNVSCYGGSDGSATASASGGTAPYTYAWSNGATGDALNDVAAGTYTVTATDDNGCTATASVTISQPTAALNASATLGSNVSCYGGADGSATASASGGTAPYTYAWSNGTIGDALNDVAAGTYTVTATDDNGCTATASVSVGQPAAALSASATLGDNVSCYGENDGSATASASGGTAPYTYAWSNGTAGNALNGVSAGTYTVTATDDNGCTATASVNVGQPALLDATISKTDVLCYGASTGSATANPTGGTTPYSYEWSNGATTASIVGLSAGTYAVTVTDANGCQAGAGTSITQPTAIMISGVVVSPTCYGATNGAVHLTVSGGTGAYSYAWSGTGSGTDNRTGLAAGDYTVTVTDANGCTATRSFTLTQPTALAISVNKVCADYYGQNTTATATVSGGTAPYTWTGTGITATAGNTLNVTLTPGTSRTYTVTDAKGCTKTVTISHCYNSCTGFRTQTPGGWGSDPSGNNPGAFLAANFATCFPTGITVGCPGTGKTLTLTSATAVNAFLPSSGAPKKLTKNWINPGTSLSNTLAGQVVALTISLGFDQCLPNYSSNSTPLGCLVIASGTLAGSTVSEVLAIANQILGGCYTGSYTPSQINNVLTAINENYIDGTTNNNYLLCNPTCTNYGKAAMAANEDMQIKATAYPNPFDAQVNIAYEIMQDTHVTVCVFDISGKLVATLTDAPQAAGEHIVEMDTNSLYAGMYFYEIRTSNSRFVGKLSKLRH
jgi:hypothetical protein